MENSYPEPLEKLFLRAEEESERRALTEKDNIDCASKNLSIDIPEGIKERRRISISISRFGQVVEPEASEGSSPGVQLSAIASKLESYHFQLINKSSDSLTEEDSANFGDEEEYVDDRNVTTIPGQRQKRLSKTMEGFLPRQMVRTRSLELPRQNSNVIIGVTVAEATVETVDTDIKSSETEVSVTGGPRLRCRRATLPSQGLLEPPPVMGNGNVKPGLLSKAKEFARKLRSKDEYSPH